MRNPLRLLQEARTRGSIVKTAAGRMRRDRSEILAALAKLENAAAAPTPLPVGRSSICRQSDFQQKWFVDTASALGTGPYFHRSLWEYVYIATALEAAGVLTPSATGLGFGVGKEPLPAYFASKGCTVLATDLSDADPRSESWQGSGQFGRSVDDLMRPDICDVDTARANIGFRSLDMTRIPADLTGYDFCWSACAFEHLGSIEAGLLFVERAMDCLKPGGVAVHTTEFNTTSDDDTLMLPGLVLFRKRDLEELVLRLERRGHTVAPLDLGDGDGILDKVPDLPPYGYPALRMEIKGFVSTSVALVITAGER